MSLATLKDKVGQLIEKAQSGGESGAIDYPEWGFTRPSWWLPRPELSDGVDEIWGLCEFPADMNSFEDIDLSNVPIARNGTKQIWLQKNCAYYTVGLFAKENGALATVDASWKNYCVELIINTKGIAKTPYHYQGRVWANLRIVTGTTIVFCVEMSDGLRWSYDLKVWECPTILCNYESFMMNSGLFKNTAIEKIPSFILNKNEPYAKGSNMFQNCQSLKGGRIESWTNLSNTFNGCVNLEDVSFSADCTGFSTNTFSGCSLLKKVSVDEGFSSSLYIHHSTQFTAEVLHAIIENYADMTGQTAPTFQVGTTNLAKIGDEHKAMLEAKNINYL